MDLFKRVIGVLVFAVGLAAILILFGYCVVGPALGLL